MKESRHPISQCNNRIIKKIIKKNMENLKHEIKKVELNHNRSSGHSMRLVQFLWKGVRVELCWYLLCLKKGHIYDIPAEFELCEFSAEV